MAMLIPEAWDADTTMNPEKRAFYEYHASLMEPWDGPAAVAFTDGRVIGATLDRNGLRPARYLVTNDDLLIMASETGVLPIKPEDVKMQGPPAARQDAAGRHWQKAASSPIEEIKQRAVRPPALSASGSRKTRSRSTSCPSRRACTAPITTRSCAASAPSATPTKICECPDDADGRRRARSRSAPWAPIRRSPAFPTSRSRCSTTSSSSSRRSPIRPSIPIREELVMSLTSYIGTERNILDETPQHCHTLKLPHPILTNRDLEKLRRVSQGDFLATTLPMLFRVDDGEKGLERALDQLCRRASLAIKSGYTLLILSDRGVDEDYAPIPSLLALTAVHNHLVREGTRTQVALIIESGEPREVMHFALLIGYGASAVNPYLAIETLEDMAQHGDLPDGVTFETALKNYKKAINKGLLKIFSKMGISTLQSYRGAQVFEAIGLNKALVEKYFTGTASRIEGVGLDVLAREAHAEARVTPSARSPNPRPSWPSAATISTASAASITCCNPLTVSKLQHAVRQRKLRDLPGIHGPDRQPEQAALHAARPDGAQDRPTSRCRSKKWSRPRRS